MSGQKSGNKKALNSRLCMESGEVIMAEHKRKKKTKTKIPENLIPTGCTLLNCTLADSPYAGYRKGTVVNLIGDSSAGKTLAAYTTLAAVAAETQFDDYRLIIDDAECAEAFDIEHLFGKKLADRIEPPFWEKGKKENKIKGHSETTQDFHMHIKDVVNDGKPFIYILDSWDSIDDEADQKKIETTYKKWKKGEQDNTGSYGTAKARESSKILRNVKSDIKKTNSLIIIISQVRENLNAGTFGSKKTRSGGKALKHYCWHEIWLILGEKIRHSSTKLQQGVHTIAKLGKNRQTGKNRDASFPIYYDLGIDDVAANTTFLESMKALKKKKQTYIIPELNFKGTKQKLIQHVEENNLEKKLQKMVGDVWEGREQEAKLNRKRRFE